MNTYYTGNLIVDTCTFTNESGEVTDPTTVTLEFTFLPSLVSTTWTVTSGQITKVSTGVYSANIDTTGQEGSCQLVWTGTGACQAVTVDTFGIQSTSV